MKKKEILIIFGLAIVITVGSLFYVREIPVSPRPIFPGHTAPLPYIIYDRGLPVFWYSESDFGEGELIYKNLVVDFLFWFLVIFVIWKIVKRVKGKTS